MKASPRPSSSGVRCAPGPPRRRARIAPSPCAPLPTSAHASRARRQYLDQLLVPFAEANPHVQICASRRPQKHPFVRGFYMQDRDKTLTLKGLSMAQVVERIHLLRDTRPVGLNKLARVFRTTPSVQGEWRLGQQLDVPHRTIRA